MGFINENSKGMKFNSLFIILIFSCFSAKAIGFEQQGIDTLLKVSEVVEEQKEEKEEMPSLEGSIRKSQEYTIQLNRINFTLSKELDSLEIMEDFPIAERLTMVIQNRLEDTDSKISIRYLQELENLLFLYNCQFVLSCAAVLL